MQRKVSILPIIAHFHNKQRNSSEKHASNDGQNGCKQRVLAAFLCSQHYNCGNYNNFEISAHFFSTREFRFTFFAFAVFVQLAFLYREIVAHAKVKKSILMARTPRNLFAAALLKG